LTGTLPVFDEICKRSSRFINSFLRSCNNLVRSVVLHSIVHGKYYPPLGRNLRFCCRCFSWQLEDFLLGFVSLNDECYHNFCMNNILVAQLQIKSLVDELLSLEKVLHAGLRFYTHSGSYNLFCMHCLSVSK